MSTAKPTTLRPASDQRYTDNSPTFRQLVAGAAEKYGNPADAPRLPKSTIFHWLNKKLALWDDFAKKIRLGLDHRLCIDGWAKTAANDKSWRMLEDAIFVSESSHGTLDLVQLRAELDGLKAYANEQQYPEHPEDEEVDAAHQDARRVFNNAGPKQHLPTTFMHYYRRLGLWPEAIGCWMATERQYLVDGKSPEFARYMAWESLSTALVASESADEIFEFLTRPTRQLAFDVVGSVTTDSLPIAYMDRIRARTERPQPRDDEEEFDFDV